MFKGIYFFMTDLMTAFNKYQHTIKMSDIAESISQMGPDMQKRRNA